jgi:hypothetical protein
MLFDLQSMFSDKQAVTTGTQVSTNVIDLGPVQTPKHAKAAITRDVGKGRPVPIRIQVAETFVGGTSTAVNLQVSNTEDFSGSPKTIALSEAIPLSELVAGRDIGPFFLPEGLDRRYLRLQYVTVGTHTAGKITAGLVFGRANWTA